MQFNKSVYSVLLASIILILNTNQISANNTVLSDNFDDGDISNWTTIRSLQWSSPQLPCRNGLNNAQWIVAGGSLKIDINGPACVTEIKPSNLDLSQLGNYQADFDWTFETSMHMDRNFALLWKDADNWIGIKVLDNTVLLQRFYQGYGHIIPGSEAVFPFEANKTYHFTTVYEKNNHVTVSIDNQKIIDVDDSAFGPEYDGAYSLAFQASVGAIRTSTTSFDNLVVTSLDDTLGVNLIRQDQEPWGPMEYDSATKWATAKQGSTFKAWGCALSSAVMIMNYHGITQMPDGSLITPLSLNNWMLENHGYYDGGNVQFPVLAALTKQLSDQYGHVALEYYREDNSANVQSLATSEITAGRPVILKKPGHFVVADGLVPNVDDFFIKDPINAFTKFSQLNAPLISTRTFMPSHTDVSYLSITTAPDSQVQIYDSTGHLLEYTPVIEQLENQSSPGEFSPAVQVIEIPKPAAGVYKVVLLNAEASAEATESATGILTITPAGGITRHIVPSGEKEALLSINADSPSQIEYTRPEGFSKLRQTILTLWQTQGIKNESLYRVLDSLAAIGEETDNKDEQMIIVRILRRVVNTHYVKQHLTREAKSTLLQEIKELQVDVKPTPTPKPTATPKPSHTPKPSPTSKPDKNEHRR